MTTTVSRGTCRNWFYHPMMNGESIPVFIQEVDPKVATMAGPMMFVEDDWKDPSNANLLNIYGVSKEVEVGITCSSLIWDNLSEQEKAVCLAHEEGHIILDHANKIAMRTAANGGKDASFEEECEIEADAYAVKVYGSDANYITASVTQRAMRMYAEEKGLDYDSLLSQAKACQPRRAAILGL